MGHLANGRLCGEVRIDDERLAVSHPPERMVLGLVNKPSRATVRPLMDKLVEFVGPSPGWARFKNGVPAVSRFDVEEVIVVGDDDEA